MREDFSAQARFVYFGAVGLVDFNYAEMAQVAAELDELGIPNRLRVFPGAHEWAPPEVQLEALEWLELRAMQAGTRPADPEFVERQFAKGASRARALEEAGELFQAYSEYRHLIRDFEGLADVSSLAAKAEELEKTDAIERGRRRRQEEIERQQALVDRLTQQLQVLDLPPSQRPLGASAELRGEIKKLQETVNRAADKSDVLVEERALRGILALAYQAGEAWLEGWGGRKQPARARPFLALVTEMRPGSQMAFVLLARAEAGAGDEKKALRALRQAVNNGFRSAALLENAEEFASLRQRKEFQELLARIRQNSEN